MIINLLSRLAAQRPSCLPDGNDALVPANGREARRAVILGNRPPAPQGTHHLGAGNPYARSSSNRRKDA